MTIEMTGARTVHEGFARYIVARFRLSDGVTLQREIEDHGPATAVLPYDPARGLAVLVSQFRAPIFYVGADDHLLEVPAGLVETDSPKDCAVREVQEEVGLRLTDLESVATCWSMPGLSTERIYLYLARYGEADRVGSGGGLPEEQEDISVHEIRLRELAAMADDGRLGDMKTLLLVQTLRLRHPELFV